MPTLCVQLLNEIYLAMPEKAAKLAKIFALDGHRPRRGFERDHGIAHPFDAGEEWLAHLHPLAGTAADFDIVGIGMLPSVRSAGMAEAKGDMKYLLLAILHAYEDRGESELATKKLGTFLTARYGSVNEGKARLGGLSAVKSAFVTMQQSLYSN